MNGGTGPWSRPLRCGQGLLLLSLLLLLAACERPWTPGSTQVARGSALFAVHCAKCHGSAGVGQDPSDPFGSADPVRGFVAPALDGQGHCADHAPGELLTLIERGSPVAGSPMVGLANRLEPAEMKAIIAYLYRLWPRPIQRLYEQRHRDELRSLLPPGV